MPPSSRAWSRHLPLPVLALVLVALLPFTGGGPAPTPSPRWTPLSAAQVSWHGSGGPQARGTFLSFNDFHGNLEPPAGSGGTVNGIPAGGAEYLATTVGRLRTEARRAGRQVLTVGAGDLIGASPLISAAFHDEPTIEAMNTLGLDLSSVGNHEFDEGVTELRRMQRGGCHPVDGCADGDGFRGASFRYLAANVVDRKTREPIFPAYAIRSIGGVKVAFIGETLKGTPSIVNPGGIASVDFLDEATTANHYAKKLAREQGVRAFVLLVHEGGAQNSPPTPLDVNGCANFAGDIGGIVSRLAPEFGLVVSGHTHRFYSCALPNSGGRSVVTSAGSFGVLATDIDVSLDRRTHRFTSVHARNVVAENGVKNADGSYRRDASGAFLLNPALVEPRMKRLVDRYRAAIAPVANREVGRITADITSGRGTPSPASPAGELPLGDVIADGMRAYVPGSDLALMNPGGIRADLVYAPDGVVTYGDAFAVQPFNNLVVTLTYTGTQLRSVLEQQFAGCDGQGTSARILQVSAGFTYSYDPAQPCGAKVSAMALNGTPITDDRSLRVSTNDFLANGGDGFTRLTAGTGRTTAPGFDVDALVAYLGAHSPLSPPPLDRITRIG
ncbi:MAG: 5-nucleotidase [Mycobacterium sp.]|nr:5-nucleotidase [Mycobacterium sp.]